MTQVQHAEARLRSWAGGAPGAPARGDVERLLHELERRQDELNAQSLELRRMRTALVAYREQLSVAQDGANIGIWGWDLQSGVLDLTPQLERLFGVEPGTLRHHEDWRPRVHPDDVAHIETECDNAIAQHRPFNLMFRVVLDSGDIRWVSGRGRAIYDAQGNVVHLVGMNQDITARKRAEQKLLAEQAAMKALIENSDGSIWAVDRNYCLIAANSAYQRDILLMYGKEFAVGENVLTPSANFPLWPIIDEWRKYYDRALRGERFSIETQHRFFDPTRWVEYRFNPIRSETGEVTGVTVYGRDVTERRRSEQKIKEQLAEISFYYDNAPIGLAVFDTNLRFVRINKRLAEINGIPAAEHIGKKVEEVVPDLAKQARRLANQILATGESITAIEISGETAAQPGVKRTWLEGWYPIKQGSQQIVGFHIIAQEITERRQAESALDIARQRLDAHFDNSPLAVIEFDPAYRVIRWSQEATRIFGWEPEEVLGRAINELGWVYEEDMDLVKQASDAMAGGLSPRNLNINRNYRKDGSVIQCEWYNSAIYGDDGELNSVMSLVLDATERNQAVDALKQSRQRLALAQHIGRLGSWEWDVQNQTLIWSDELYHIFGVDHDFELNYDAIEAMIHPDDREMNNAKVQRAFENADDVAFEFRIIQPDGAVRHLLQSIVVLRTASGEPSRLFGVMQDITERKQAEEQHIQLQAQLAQSQKMEVVGRLAGGVAHEFNNMLSVVLMHTEMSMRLVGSSVPIYRNLKTVYDTANRSAELVQKLLGFARQQVIEPEPLSLNDTIESSMPILRKLLGEEIDLVWRPHPSLWTVKMDQSQVDQVVLNLCINAGDAIDGYGMISIETSNVTVSEDGSARASAAHPGDYVMVTITDTGRGMDEETMAHIFEPFFTTKEVGKGTGMGLPMVEGIVQQNGGWMEVSSEVGRGTSVRLYVPRLVEPAADAPSPRKQVTTPRGGGETILLVEDEVVVLRMVADIIEHLGYKVIAASAPEEALHRISERGEVVDLLVTDIIMPEMSGVELAARLTELQPQMKCLYVSGYPSDYAVQRGLLTDEVHFLQKPYTLHALTAKLREVLDEQP